MANPVFWLIAGPNGAGKTTFVQRSPFFSRLLPGTVLLNPDNVVLLMAKKAGYAGFHDVPPDILRDFNIEAANLVMESLRERLFRGDHVAVETVLSSAKYQSVVEDVLAMGGEFHLVYVALNSWHLSAERIRTRVSQGGHDVPLEKLEARWKRSVALLPWFASRAASFYIVDNSDSTHGVSPKLIAEGGKGRLLIHHPEAIPLLTNELNDAWKRD